MKLYTMHGGIVFIFNLLLSAKLTSSLFSHFALQNHKNRWTNKNASSSISSHPSGEIIHSTEEYDSLEATFNSIVMKRYACTRFHRHLEQAGVIQTSKPLASISNPEIVEKAMDCIDYSRRAPSGFNAQPYRVIVVHNVKEKEELAQYCLGRNADRVRDSDCTMIFLADKEVSRHWNRFGQFLKEGGGRVRRQRQQLDVQDSVQEKKKLQQSILKAQALVLLFSSGWPLPRFLAVPLSFAIRFTVSFISVVTRRRILVPSLASAETWATKNTMLVAMTFMLGCTARGLDSCPMEGYNVGGIRKVLKIPKRYAIPLIVSVGIPYSSALDINDDAGMSHGPVGNAVATPRYPMEEIVFDNTFGNVISLDHVSHVK